MLFWLNIYDVSAKHKKCGVVRPADLKLRSLEPYLDTYRCTRDYLSPGDAEGIK